MLFLLKRWTCGCLVCAIILPVTAKSFGEGATSNALSLAELQRLVVRDGLAVRSFHLEGVVCASVAESRIVALQDDSAAVLLELPAVDGAVRVGDRLAIEGNQCTLLRNRFGVRLGTELVNNDGVHRAICKSSRIFLRAGRQPICVEWFSASTAAVLNLQYEGPGIQRQPVPAGRLWWQPPGPADFSPGLHFAAYAQPHIQGVAPTPDNWRALPDFAKLKPKIEGMATNFNVGYRTQDECAALVFSGFIEIPAPGFYTFYLESDDGSRLYVGDPEERCKVTATGTLLTPACLPWEQAAGVPSFRWNELSGTITFVGMDENGVELELSTGRGPVQVVVLGNLPDSFSGLLHQRIVTTGISEASPSGGALMVVPGWDQVKISTHPGSTRPSPINAVLTLAGQVRRLKPDQARTGILTRVKGVAIAATSDSLVLQDDSGGVFIHWSSDDLATQPRVGELWEIEGRTDPGDFSPVIFATKAKFLGNSPLPEPIRPTWDQLMNGSLDAEYVEVHGVITGISSNEMTLLTPDGKFTIEGDNQRPLPELPVSVSGGGSLAGSQVRMRGCFTADWNWQTRQVNGGKFNLYPAMVDVEELAPADPFSLPTTDAADLLRFNARASALQRTKVAGQIIHIRPGEYFVQGGQSGLRVHVNEPSPLRTGDLIEAVGFPKLGGPSPVLQAAQIRKKGRELLPAPVRVSPDEMLDRTHDSTWVQVEAMLLSDIVHQGERVLELQSGPQRFAAILKSDQRTWTLLPAGTRVRVTGVYASEDQEQADVGFYPFELLLNNAANIFVLQRPSWWTVRRAVTVASALAAALGVAFVWITLLHRKVEQRTAQLQKEIEARQLIEQHRIMEQERARVARDLHDELGTGLTEVSMLGELGTNPAVSSEEKERCFQQIMASARALVTGLDEIVWAINPSYDSVSSMATYYSFFADRFLNLAGITCRLRIPKGFPEVSLASNIRHGVFLACKEALNNVVRHSGATEVEFQMETVDDVLSIVIRDNGKGILSEGGGPGNDGLTGMRQRLHEFGGNCRINGQPGKGTTVELRLPLQPLLRPKTGGRAADSFKAGVSDGDT